MNPLRLIFMGTPMFALPTLEALIRSPHQVVAVYSQPPRPAGRGQKLTSSPVHQIAEKHNIPVFTPVSLKPSEVQAEFAAHKADAAIVAAYGLLLPKPILTGTRLGCINVHPSLLPRWRGAAPLPRTIMAGDKKTGVCIMQMDEGLDTGDVLLMKEYAIPAGMNAAELHDTLSEMAAPMILETLDGMSAGRLMPVKQSAEGVTYAKKIEKEDCLIDWNRSASEIAAQVRGLAPKPGASFHLKNEVIKLLAAQVEDGTGHATPGTALDDQLLIACGSGALRMLQLQRPSKAPMPASELMKGFPIPKGTVLE